MVNVGIQSTFMVGVCTCVRCSAVNVGTLTPEVQYYDKHRAKQSASVPLRFEMEDGLFNIKLWDTPLQQTLVWI